MPNRLYVVNGTSIKALRVSNADWLAGRDLETTSTDLTEHEAYKVISYIYRCVHLRAQNVAAMPYKIIRQSKNGDEINWPPSKQLNDLLYRTEGALCIYGAAYWFRHPVKGPRDSAFRWLLPSSIRLEIDPITGDITFHRRIQNGIEKPFTADDMVYFWLPSFDAEVGYGVSPVHNALKAAQLQFYADTFAAGFFERGAIPGVILQVDQETSDSETKRIEKWWKKMLQGVRSAWETIAIRGGIEPKVISQPIGELAMPELKVAARIEIATAMGIRPSMLEQSANYATASSDRLGFYQETIVPECKWIGEVINTQILDQYGLELVWLPETLDVFQEDEAQRAASLQALTIAGFPLWMAAQMLGYELPEGVVWEDLKPKEKAESAPSTTSPVALPEQLTVTEEAPVMEKETKSFDLSLLRSELRRWQRASLRAIYVHKDADCHFESDIIPEHWTEWIHGQLSKCIDGEQVKRLFLALKQFIPKKGGSLPELPDKVEITDDDIDAAIDYWDKVMGPEFAGLLDAEPMRK